MELVTIHGLGSEMQGVGRLADGRTVFVPGALPGEKCTIEIERVAKRFCEARLVHVEEPSAQRAVPHCKYYDVCGGCQAQHMQYETTLAQKRIRVKDALERIGDFGDPLVYDAIGCYGKDRLRNKAEFAIENRRIGMRAKGSHRLIPIRQCMLQRPQSNHCLAVADELLRTNPRTQILKGLVTRVNGKGELMAILTAQANPSALVRELLPHLRQALPEMVSLYALQLCDRPTHALDGKPEHIWGTHYLNDTLMDLGFEISPQSFFQVNTSRAEVLYQRTLEAIGLPGKKGIRVLDAYCGIGTISLCAAKQGANVVGVEIVPPAVENARRNAQRNDLHDNTRFYCGDAPNLVKKLLEEGESFDAVIVDPPRKGIDSWMLHALADANIPRIAYVSCDPGTLARDLAILAERGYWFEWAQPVDMFPWTGHVETIALISRESN